MQSSNLGTEAVLFKYGFPHHMLGMLKSLRTQIGKGPGDTVMITLKRVN